MMRRRATLWACMAVLVAAWAAPDAAMVVVQRDFPALVARAEQIVVGTVTSVDEQQDADGVPHTFVTFSDLTALKGDVGGSLTLQLYGGHMGQTMVRVADMPAFTLGERDVVFVAGNGHDICPLVGVWQGRFHVLHDAARGADVVQDNDGRPVTGLAGRTLLRAPRRATAGAPPALTLDDFRQLIADELAHPQGAAQE